MKHKFRVAIDAHCNFTETKEYASKKIAIFDTLEQAHKWCVLNHSRIEAIAKKLLKFHQARCLDVVCVPCNPETGKSIGTLFGIPFFEQRFFLKEISQ